MIFTFHFGEEAEKQCGLLCALDSLVDPTAVGNPENPLKWTSKSVRKLSKELNNQGYRICYKTVSTLLKELGYSLQSNKKTLEKDQHVDRDEMSNLTISIKRRYRCKNVIVLLFR